MILNNVIGIVSVRKELQKYIMCAGEGARCFLCVLLELDIASINIIGIITSIIRCKYN